MIRSAAMSLVLSIAATQLWSATVGDPDRPGIMGPDSRLLGDRDSVTLSRWNDTPGDEEPLYVVSESGTEIGFAREGDQCYSAKFGGDIVPCEGATARAVETAQALGAGTANGVTSFDWPVPPLLPPLDGGDVYVVTPEPAPPVDPIPSVPAPAAALLLLSALVGIVAIGVRR